MDPQPILLRPSWFDGRIASRRPRAARWGAAERPAVLRGAIVADERPVAAKRYTAGVLSGAELLQDRWGQLLPPDDPLWAWPVFAAAERARNRPDHHGYAAVRRQGDVIAVLPMSGFRGLRLPSVLGAGDGGLPGRVDRVLPPMSVLLCGNPLGRGRVLSAGPLLEPVADRLVREVLAHARLREFDVVVFKDFAEPDLAPLRRSLLRSRFFFAPAPPDLELRLGRFHPPRLPAPPGTRVEVLDDFQRLLPQVADLHRAAAGVVDVLDEEFLRVLRPVDGLRRKLIACFRDDRLVAYLLCLFAGSGATAVQVALDERVVEEAGLRGLAAELAAAEGCERIRFPRAAARDAARTGGELVEQSFAITHLKPLPRAVLRGLLPGVLSR
ncbi:GNAT family N-acetyltransferase [Saccharothrix coeruleofusca]|uniref:Uncharacterized protein n=1 Tax=Saccharothrix coeruleofusca TaxID=33919 RepID=A0A918AM84_9PSEU|nr:GNAT family N-acetyltransferase [Saccharothrix coeruleofusca]GGP55243.1 hypothetical protein GCM10010185_29750 [Saccharothrix coeruleofusca]